MVQVFGSVEDDGCFSVLTLYKCKFCNQFTKQPRFSGKNVLWKVLQLA